MSCNFFKHLLQKFSSKSNNTGIEKSYALSSINTTTTVFSEIPKRDGFYSRPTGVTRPSVTPVTPKHEVVSNADMGTSSATNLKNTYLAPCQSALSKSAWKDNVPEMKRKPVGVTRKDQELNSTSIKDFAFRDAQIGTKKKKQGQKGHPWSVEDADNGSRGKEADERKGGEGGRAGYVTAVSEVIESGIHSRGSGGYSGAQGGGGGLSSSCDGGSSGAEV